MKQLIYDLHREVNYELGKMKKDKMSLLERISYEKALVQLENIRKLMDKCSVTFNS